MSGSGEPAFDPVLFAIVQKQLDHITLHMGRVMTRTARSPIFSQSHDFSCFLCSSTGQLLAQADGIPAHTGGGAFAARAVLNDFAGRIFEEDVFILSDPYVAGGNHLPDWTIIRPVFLDGLLTAFACNRAHQSDIGGGAAGTYNAAATEIFHEGIRLPVMKLIDRGRMRTDYWRLLLLNSRCPDLMEGDLGAMIGSTRIGAERVQAILEDLGGARAAAYFDAVLDYAERAMRAEIGKLPDGVYYGEDVSDTDCFEIVDVVHTVKLTIAGDTLHFDFTGSSPQIKGFKNSCMPQTHSAVYLAVSSFFRSDMPRNEGSYRPVSIVAPPGTVVNALPPAPVTMNTVYPTQDIANACWKALAQAMPERACAGWGKVSYGVSAGNAADGRVFVMYHWHASPGGGAVLGRDGFECSGQFTTLGGLTLPNVELYEQTYPVRIDRQELRCDAGGPGQYRGGASVDYEAEIFVPTQHSIRAEGIGKPTGFGTNGGMEGAKGSLRVAENGGPFEAMPHYDVRYVGPMRAIVEGTAGGGFGDPKLRDPAAVLRDVRGGIVSPAAARDVYGVAIAANGRSVDMTATKELRA